MYFQLLARICRSRWMKFSDGCIATSRPSARWMCGEQDTSLPMDWNSSSDCLIWNNLISAGGKVFSFLPIVFLLSYLMVVAQ